MQSTITPKLPTSQVELQITVPTDDFKPYLEKAARHLTKEKALPGFRPGKAPLPVVMEAYGQDRLLHEAMDLALPNFFVEAVLEHQVDAINRPAITIEELGIAQPFRFRAVVDVLPQVKLGKLKTLKAEPRSVSVTAEEVAKELAHLAKTRSTFLEVPRPAQAGDTVTVDFTVMMDGAVMAGGASKNHPVHLGEGHFVPDFEKNITGITAGEERAFPIEFPADFAKEDLRGKKADVKVLAHRVQKRVIPEVNDAFARQIGKFTSLAHLKEELTKNMEQEKAKKEQERRRSQLMEALAATATFGFIPAILINQEIDRRLADLTQLLAYQQKTLDQYLAEQKKTLAQIREEIKPAAQAGVKVALAIRQFAADQKIEVTEEEIEREANDYLKHYKTVHQADESLDPQELHDHIATRLKNEKTLQRLEEIAGK